MPLKVNFKGRLHKSKIGLWLEHVGVPIVAPHCSFAEATAGRAISAACVLPDMPKLLPHRIPSLGMAFVCPYPSVTLGGKGQVFLGGGKNIVPDPVVEFSKTSALPGSQLLK